MSRSGFTLIEAVIASALSMIIVATAFLGLRAAAAGTATANQLSLENGLIREGYLRANEIADHTLRRVREVMEMLY